MRVLAALIVLLTPCAASAQSTAVLDRIVQASEICRQSLVASLADRPAVWTKARKAQFVQKTPTDPYSWSGEGFTVRLAPKVAHGVPGCDVVVVGPLRPTAVVSAVAGWARAAGFVAVQNPRLLFSMQTNDLYLDASRTGDGVAMDFGWRDD